MINGVLAEKTVKDVLPALETNSEGLKNVLDELVKQYKRQQEDMESWKVSFRSKFVSSSCHTGMDWHGLRLHIRLHPFRLEH